MLLLNASLTVRAHNANSHAKKGWEDFTDAAIKALSLKRKGLVFLLWGRNAQQKATKGIIDKGRHHVLMSAHPSGLSANKVILKHQGERCLLKGHIHDNRLAAHVVS